MANYIRVSTEQLERDKTEIQEEMSGVHKAVEELWEEMQALGTTWEGPAWQTFQSQMASDIENMQKVCEKIAEFISHMEYAENEYKSCENQVRDLIAGIRI